MKKNKLYIAGVLVVVGVALGAVFLESVADRKPSGVAAVRFDSVPDSYARWKSLILSEGPEDGYIEFKRENKNSSFGEQHLNAHIFGEVLYELEGIDDIGTCDALFQFGCYHGFFNIAVYSEGPAVLEKLDQACIRMWGKDDFLPCQHGIGHGILTYTGPDNLLEALHYCRALTWQERGGCSGGVFMEYNFRTRDDLSGVDVRSLSDGEDAYSPCSELPSSFRLACYAEQPQWWASVFDSDWPRMGKLCDGLDQLKEQGVCFQAIGNYSAAESAFSVKKVLDICASMPNLSSQSECTEGASWIMLTQKDGRALGAELCQSLPPREAQECQNKLNANRFNVVEEG